MKALSEPRVCHGGAGPAGMVTAWSCGGEPGAMRTAVGVSYVYTTIMVNVVREQVYQGILATNTQFQKHTKSQAHKAATNGPSQYVLVLTKKQRSIKIHHRHKFNQ